MRANFILRSDISAEDVMTLQKELGELEFSRSGETLILSVSPFRRKRARVALEALGILKESKSTRGERYKRRHGILFGILLVALMLMFSGTRIWTVEIQGNVNLSEEAILEMLKREGLFPGVSGDFSLPTVAAKCVAANPEIAWMSLGRHGTTVTCVVLETKMAKEEPIYAGANLRTVCDATVLEVNVSRGKALVSKGQTVKKGDLLVSGVIEGVQGTFAMEAEGTVIGQVTEILTEKVPLDVVKKEYLEAKGAVQEIIFFGFPIKIWKNSRNSPQKYDTIEYTEPLVLFGRPLPIFVSQAISMPYVSRVEQLSEKEARNIALGILGERIRALAESGELLEKNVDFRIENGFLIAECRVSYTCMIAECVPFSLELFQS